MKVFKHKILLVLFAGGVAVGLVFCGVSLYKNTLSSSHTKARSVITYESSIKGIRQSQPRVKSANTTVKQEPTQTDLLLNPVVPPVVSANTATADTSPLPAPANQQKSTSVQAPPPIVQPVTALVDNAAVIATCLAQKQADLALNTTQTATESTMYTSNLATIDATHTAAGTFGGDSYNAAVGIEIGRHTTVLNALEATLAAVQATVCS